jgi:DegV family protein with EDD domain
MAKVAIVTDSTAYIPAELVKQYNLTIAPQVLIWGEKSYKDGVDIQPDEFYTRLSNATVMPSTSQVTIPDFTRIFGDLKEQGYDILAVLISNALSGTIDSAIHAKAAHPEANIEIVDSYTTAMAMGYQVLSVARAAQEGASLAECKALAEKARQHVGVVFAVDTLEFLHRGGRIGGGSRFLATALNIKPILEVTGGKVEGIEKVRTRKKSLQRLVELLVERCAGRQPVRLATLHANAEEDAKELLALAMEVVTPVESILAGVSPVIGTHGGPGLVGLAFMAGM